MEKTANNHCVLTITGKILRTTEVKTKLNLFFSSFAERKNPFFRIQFVLPGNKLCIINTHGNENNALNEHAKILDNSEFVPQEKCGIEIPGKILKKTTVKMKISLILFENNRIENHPYFQIQIKLPGGLICNVKNHVDKEIAQNEYEAILESCRKSCP